MNEIVIRDMDAHHDRAATRCRRWFNVGTDMILFRYVILLLFYLGTLWFGGYIFYIAGAIR